MEFSKRLKSSRQNMKLTQKELSEKTGIKRTTIASYEVGNISPSFENVKLLADALNVSTDFLSGKNDFIERFDSEFDLSKIKSEIKVCQEINCLISELSSFDFSGAEFDYDELVLIRDDLKNIHKLLKILK